MLVSGALFLLLYFVVFAAFNLEFPGYVAAVWNLPELSRVFVAGVPLEELMFAFTFGLYWSSVYEHLAWSARMFAWPAPLTSRVRSMPCPALIISASGMATGGRVLHHLRQRLPDARTTVLLVGYQAIGTRGRQLQEGATPLGLFGEQVPVRAHMETIHGLSAHADSEGLMRWLRTASRPPTRVFVVHGDRVPARALATRIAKELDWAVDVPA